MGEPLNPVGPRNAVDRPPPNDEEPYATVARYSRGTWYITVTHGLISWGPDGGGWFCVGSRERAVRKARRKLRAYRRTLDRPEYRVEEP